MTVLDHQRQEFVGGDRLIAMVLGLAASAGRVVELLAVPGRGLPATNGRHPLAFAMLGVVSLRRTLWSALALQPPAAAPGSPPASARIDGEPPASGLLR
jgi:hypothetical protein